MKVVTDEQLVARLAALPAGARVLAGGNFATPWHLLELAERSLPEYRLLVLNAQHGMPDRAGVTLETPFVGPGMRDHAMLEYLPMRLSLVPSFIAGAGAPQAVLVQTSPPRAGRISLGVEVNVLPAAIESARRREALVVAEVNRHMPYTYGDGEIDTAMFDLAVEHDSPLVSPPAPAAAAAADDVNLRIGELVAQLVEDGSTLQAGIGGVPDATLAHLLRRRGLRIWSEMISDGVLRLERAGALDDRQQIVCSFLFGSGELYEWAERNDRLRLQRTEVTNDPRAIAANERMLSVNAALEVDLFAQANASWVRGRVYSGFGGQPDFTVGALHSAGGHAIIALPSWHPRADVSSIVPLLRGPVTSFQHSAIVTEQGCAFLFGRGHHAQAEAIASRAAHPRAREQLLASAAEHRPARSLPDLVSAADDDD